MLIHILTLVSLLALVTAPSEYYSLLGISHGSAENEIKRAFKRLAAKYHPDRAPQAQKEEYNKKFSEISDAYSVLTDPELKSTYDQRGHAGLEDLRKHKDWQNQHNARQEYHDSMVTDHFQGTDLQILNVQSLSRFYRRTTPWLVLFYRSQDAEMRSGLKEAILDLNNKFYGIFTVAAVNCDVDDGICDEYRAVNTPDIFGFNSDVSHDGIRYTGDKASSKMAGFAVSLMQDFVSVVTPATVDEFLGKWDKVKMLVFSAKKEVSPLMKALSKEFRTSIEIGQVKDDTQTIMQRFKVNQLPAVIILKNEGVDVVQYGGQLTLMGLSDFIREHRDLSGAKDKKKIKKLHDITAASEILKNGCGPQSKSFCVFIPYHNGAQKEAITREATRAIELLGDEPVILQTLDASILNFDMLGVNPKAAFFVVKLARGKVHVSSEEHFAASDLLNVLDLAVGGTLSFSPLKGDLQMALGGEPSEEL